MELKEGTVAVYRSVRAKGDTKTRRSRRVLQLPKQVAASLKAHHRQQAADRLQAGEAWQDHDLVFCRADGTPLDRWQVRREFAEITKAAELGEDWTPSELRHSFVSILSASDVPLEDISQLVGHVFHQRHGDRLPARDPARADQGRHGHGQDPQEEEQDRLARSARWVAPLLAPLRSKRSPGDSRNPF